MRVTTLSVLICTYNRAPLLEETLDAFTTVEAPDGCQVQLVLVDNNSSDRTPEVIGRAAARLRFPVVHLREARQGKSFALNAGLAHAAGHVVALTDDDVVPARDWLQRVVIAFSNRDVTFAFGKVLPRWEVAPPPGLLTREAQAIWGPLALVDYGDEVTDYPEERFGAARFPIGANLAFARRALVAIGGWRNDLGKVDNSLIAGEDYEIFHRLRRAGLYSGVYDPSIVVHHLVPAARLSPRYFRRWFYWNGRTIARMLPDYYTSLDFSQVPRVAGVPRFLYRQCAEQVLTWLRGVARGERLDHRIQELYAIRYFGIIVECWRAGRRVRQASALPPGASAKPREAA